jgi:hypothetical protein
MHLTWPVGHNTIGISKFVCDSYVDSVDSSNKIKKYSYIFVIFLIMDSH